MVSRSARPPAASHWTAPLLPHTSPGGRGEPNSPHFDFISVVCACVSHTTHIPTTQTTHKQHWEGECCWGVEVFVEGVFLFLPYYFWYSWYSFFVFSFLPSIFIYHDYFVILFFISFFLGKYYPSNWERRQRARQCWPALQPTKAAHCLTCTSPRPHDLRRWEALAG
ncbi:hypothetical protein B0T26DRAFT_77802 [Lasiosphaeria miniovina]|uniref:Uncharacterized protein n=1 Tax=Lasiosphaeria miniovina TaxID=1954250 RepID=A0AA40EAP9_9PEZI|nr:uncharacterized protein B0T26DRAFT_77802 [Lasiosphaeria miniovina]KAK0734644.1 hypothetical protein B0T26DRAFT_77802 [Lasiosphaeria miniovina]